MLHRFSSRLFSVTAAAVLGLTLAGTPTDVRADQSQEEIRNFLGCMIRDARLEKPVKLQPNPTARDLVMVMHEIMKNIQRNSSDKNYIVDELRRVEMILTYCRLNIAGEKEQIELMERINTMRRRQ
jgi:hypothetical protein